MLPINLASYWYFFVPLSPVVSSWMSDFISASDVVLSYNLTRVVLLSVLSHVYTVPLTVYVSGVVTYPQTSHVPSEFSSVWLAALTSFSQVSHTFQCWVSLCSHVTLHLWPVAGISNSSVSQEVKLLNSAVYVFLPTLSQVAAFIIFSVILVAFSVSTWPVSFWHTLFAVQVP